MNFILQNKIIFFVILILAIAAGLFGAGEYFKTEEAWAEESCLIKTENFENSWTVCTCACKQENWMYGCGMINCAKTSSEAKRSGQSSLKFDFKYDDVKNLTNEIFKRCEYHWMGALQNLIYGTEFWLAFSVYFPADWKPDSKFGHIIFQMHQNPDGCDTLANPPMALSYNPNGSLELHFAGDSRDCMSDSYQTSKYRILGNVIPGSWHDFVLHAKISYNPDAFVQFWINGEKKVDEKNVRTCYNNTQKYGTYTYLKFGLYTWSWKNVNYPIGTSPDPDRIIVYYDDIKFGNNTCSYDDFIFGEAPPAPSCHLYTNTTSVPTGFGASWNTLTTTKEMLMKASCADTSTTFEIGNGNQSMYIYKNGYYYKDSKWNPITFTGTAVSGSDVWLKGNANYTLSNSPSSGYVAAYICQYINNAWKCGCRDANCSTPYWNLQKWSK